MLYVGGVVLLAIFVLILKVKPDLAPGIDEVDVYSEDDIHHDEERKAA